MWLKLAYRRKKGIANHTEQARKLHYDAARRTDKDAQLKRYISLTQKNL